MASEYTQEDIQKLLTEVESLRAKLSEKDATINKLDTTINKLDATINELNGQLEWLRKKVFGKMSERFIASNPDERQLDLFGDQLSDEEKRELEKAASQEDDLITRTIKVKKPHTPRKEVSMDNLRVEETIIDPEGINDDEYVCIGSEVTNKLAIRSAEFYVKRTIRRKYALKNQTITDDQDKNNKPTILIAPLPDSPIHKCMADTSLLTEIIIQKYLYHMPFHRQISRFAELGIKISSSTVGDWFSETCQLLKPLYDILRERVLSSDYIQVDESTLPVVDNEKKRAVKGYLWVLRNPVSGEVFFHYDGGSRSEKTAMVLLHDFRGAIQSDGYQVYNKFERLDGKLMLGCWAHARRKFEEALSENNKTATEALIYIQKLYAVEREADDAGATPEQRKEMRYKNSYPILVTFEKWLMENYGNHLKQSRTAKAIAYTYSIFPKLSRYHLDGRYRIDNNLVENAIRPLALGRKNFLFCGNHEAAIRAAVIYSLLGSCKAAGVNPTEWLSDVISKIYSYQKEKQNIEDLLPNIWAENLKKGL